MTVHDRPEYAAAPLYRQGLNIRLQTLSRNNPDVAKSLASMARISMHQDPCVAERLYREALAIRQQVRPKHHPDIADNIYELGTSLALQGRIMEAESAYREALAMRNAKLDTAKDECALAGVLPTFRT